MQNSSLIRLVELEKKSIAKFVFGYIFYDFVEALRFVGRQENPRHILRITYMYYGFSK